MKDTKHLFDLIGTIDQYVWWLQPQACLSGEGGKLWWRHPADGAGLVRISAVAAARPALPAEFEVTPEQAGHDDLPRAGDNE
jgi:hypothetical protein